MRSERSKIFVQIGLYCIISELGVLGCARERDNVPDVLHSCHEQDQALKAQAESGVRARTPAAGIQIPPQVCHIHLTAVDLTHKVVIIGLTERSAYDLTNLREENVCTLHGRCGSLDALVTD